MAKDKVAPTAPPVTKPTPAASAKPGTPDANGAKPEKIKRVEYKAPDGAAWVDDKGLFIRKPDDFDPKKHLPIKRKQYADDSVALLIRADDLEARAKKLREMAEEAKKLGGLKEKGKAKRLLSMHKKFAELQEQLKAAGIDVEALLAGAPMVENAEPAAEAAS